MSFQRQNGDIRISSATVLNVASATKWGHLKLVSDCFVISLQRQNGDIGISSATVLQCRFSDKMEILKYHQRLFCNVASVAIWRHWNSPLFVAEFQKKNPSHSNDLSVAHRCAVHNSLKTYVLNFL